METEFCDNCKFIEKSFDGICDENLICEKLNDALGLMGIPHKLGEKFRFYIKSEAMFSHVGFRCSFYERKIELKKLADANGIPRYGNTPL